MIDRALNAPPSVGKVSGIDGQQLRVAQRLEMAAKAPLHRDDPHDADEHEHERNRAGARENEHLGRRFGALRLGCGGRSRAAVALWRRSRRRSIGAPAAFARIGHVETRPFENDRGGVEDASHGCAASGTRLGMVVVEAVANLSDFPAARAPIVVQRHGNVSIPELAVSVNDC